MRFVGLDLAWSSRNPSGVVVLASGEEGVWIPTHWSAGLKDDQELLGFIREAVGMEPALIAIDAPLIVLNETGTRPCDRELSQAYRKRRSVLSSEHMWKKEHPYARWWKYSRTPPWWSFSDSKEPSSTNRERDAHLRFACGSSPATWSSSALSSGGSRPWRTCLTPASAPISAFGSGTGGRQATAFLATKRRASSSSRCGQTLNSPGYGKLLVQCSAPQWKREKGAPVDSSAPHHIG